MSQNSIITASGMPTNLARTASPKPIVSTPISSSPLGRAGSASERRKARGAMASSPSSL
jgi:hypothetical protein